MTVSIGPPATAQLVSGFASGYVVAGTTVNNVTTFGPINQFAVGNDTYTDFAGGRWGDYSATTLDPSDPSKFWTIQEFAPSANQWQTQIAEVSVGAGNTVNLLQCFSGTSFNNEPPLSLNNNFQFVPPDTTAAAGPNNIAELLNGAYAVYDKNGNLQGTRQSLNQFWTNAGVNVGGVSATNFTTDPRVLYDPNSGHWFAATITNLVPNNNFLVAVSKTSDPTQGWTGVEIPSNPTSNSTADFPTLGIDASGVFISANDVNNGNNTTLVIDKNALINGNVTSTTGFTRFENFSASSVGHTLQPAVDLTNGNLPELLLSDFNTPAGVLKLSDIGGTISSPSAPTAVASLTANPFNAPTAPVQPNIATNIAAAGPPDLRLSSSVVLTNSGLWAAQTVLDPTVQHDAIRWLDINPTNGTVTQQGEFRDANLSFYYPSISVNPSGQVVIGFSGSGPITPESLNSFQAFPVAQAAEFSFVLQGDQRSAISLLETAHDPLVNAFAYVNQNLFGGNGTSDVTVSLDGNGNTVVTYTGSHPILPSYRFNYGGPTNGAPHFGYDGSAGSILLSQFWTNSVEGESSTQLLPTLSVLGPEAELPTISEPSSTDDSDDVPIMGAVPPGGPISYATLFADVTCNGQTDGQWNEVAFATGTTPTLTLSNPTSCAETLSDVGFLLSITHIAKDDLNFAMEPPPGVMDSMFIDLPNLDGMELLPGASISVALATPEPDSWLLLVTGCAGVLLLGNWRRVARRPRSPR